MSVVKWIKKQVNNVLLPELEAFARKAEATLDEESITHQKILNLYNEVNRVYSFNESKLEPKVKDAAKAFLRDLDNLLKEDKRKPPLEKHHPNGQVALAEQAIDIIFKHKPALESSPGFWNQLKARINVFIEKVSGEKNVLDTNKTAFFSKAIQQKQERIHETKDKMENEGSRPK